MKNIRKLYAATLSLAIMAVLVSGTNAASQTVVRVEPKQNIAKLGQQFTVNISVIDVENLSGLEIKLYWNATILRLSSTDVMLGEESHPKGVLYGNVWENETIENGEYKVYGTSVGEQTPSFNGSGTIVRLTFNVTNNGSCDLTLQTALYDKPPIGQAANPIQHSTQNGYFTTVDNSYWYAYLLLAAILVVIIIVSALYLRKSKTKKS